MAPMVILIPFMGKMSVKFGKKEISTWLNILAIVVLIVMLFIPFARNTTSAWIYAALLGITMFAGGTFMLATWSMVADCVDQQELSTGKREEGSVYATYSLARKIAQGVGAAFVSWCLGLVGYDAANVASTSQETAEGLLRLSIILPLVGFIVVFLSLLFIYNLNKKKVIENSEKLRELHAQQNEEETESELGEIFYSTDEENEVATAFESGIGVESITNSVSVVSEDKNITLEEDKTSYAEPTDDASTSEDNDVPKE